MRRRHSAVGCTCVYCYAADPRQPTRAAAPSCVLMCSSGSLHFGDLDDPHSNVSKLLKNRRAQRLFTGVETEPTVYYLVEKNPVEDNRT